MKSILALAATIAVGAAAFVAPHVAQAQRGGDTVNCYSDNGRRSYCRVPWRDARLIRQDSRTACIRGRTWDIDRGGLWVDDGCRGIFQEARGWGGGGRPGWDDHRPGWDDHRPGWGGGPGGDGRIVSCDSNDNKRVFCRWPIGRGARLVEQTSQAICREGYSYGFTRDGIWADRGCRGKFAIGR
ncbi:DUF3011 domain-containing protein [Luteibacter yeojuensis]|uniref:DUF3011 domain-containing protein n=1 Tax=Luteibacter yeojuensis TaxID=345309 RepID=A0A7X5QXG2_9GAMM|nr:DUF3011 domain-containing protein [Luteibacter yeojuensis]NID17144.1 DUF3011 domain-containing protein [Luteibacter yeojuensis]